MLDFPLEIRIGTAGTAGAGGAGARSITSAGEAVALTVPHFVVHSVLSQYLSRSHMTRLGLFAWIEARMKSHIWPCNPVVQLQLTEFGEASLSNTHARANLLTSVARPLAESAPSAEMLAPRRVCEKLRMHTSTFTSRGIGGGIGDMGSCVGDPDGRSVGACVGRVVGNSVAGLGIARVVGTSVGVAVGRAVGAFVGACVGAKLQSRSARSQLER